MKRLFTMGLALLMVKVLRYPRNLVLESLRQPLLKTL